MNKKIDLTNGSDFSTRRIPKIVKLYRLPWEEFKFDIRIPWEEKEDSCDRCGAATQLLPWIVELPWFCQRCAGLLIEDKLPWEDEPLLKDDYNTVFLTEFMDRRR